jgi:hypothetical protein
MSEITWKYQNNTYKVGESLNEYPWEEDNIFPIVFYKKKLYTAYIKSARKIDKVCLKDIYYPDKKVYWITVDKVFNIIKV